MKKYKGLFFILLAITRSLLIFIKNIFFPPLCGVCRKDCGKFLCDICATKLIPSFQLQNYSFDIPIYTLFQKNYTIKILIHNLKYRFYEEIADIFSNTLQDGLQKLDLHNSLYSFVPVPLHPTRKSMRGFNQTEKILQGFSQISIIRKRNTHSQARLQRYQRIQNVKDAFVCRDTLDSACTYIIFDDVVTTGSTIIEVATALRKSGAERIIGLALTRGI